MPANERIGDPFDCGDTSAVGSGNVFINGIPQTRIGDATTGHPCGPPTTNQTGSTSTVYANNIPVCRLGDALVPHGTCASPPHVGNFSRGSPNVFTDNGSGAGIINDFNPPYTIPGIDAPPGANPTPPPEYENNTEATIYTYEHNDDPVEFLPGPPTGTLDRPLSEIEDDQTPPPIDPPPTQNCSTVDALPSSFTWWPHVPPPNLPDDFQTWAQSLVLSPNFTVWDMCNGAVGRHIFTTSPTQASGLSQKQILQNMCYHAKTILEPLLAQYGTFTITSGFRQSSGSSQHNIGQATDIQFLNLHNRRDENMKLITGHLYFDRAKNIRDNINFDQLILEWFGNNPWFHISSNSSLHRHSVLTQVSRSSYAPGLRLLS